MTSFAEIAETFDMLGDWEERYGYLIELGKAMPPMDPALKTEANRVQGCVSQVWLHFIPSTDGRLHFQGDSDALIVRGLVAVMTALLSGRPLAEVAATDAMAALAPLGLAGHLSPQRSNGLRAMADRIRVRAQAAL